MPCPPRPQEGDDDLDDRELPDEADQDDDDEPETIPCPYCRAPISEEAELCPRCNSFISFEDAPPSKPWWLIIAAVVLVAAIVVLWTR